MTARPHTPDDQAVISLLAERHQIRLLVYLQSVRQADRSLLQRVLDLDERALEALIARLLEEECVQMLGQDKTVLVVITSAGERRVTAHFDALAEALSAQP